MKRLGAVLKHHLAEAFGSMGENAVTTLLTTATLAFTLAILASFAVVFYNINGALEGIKGQAHIVVYVKDPLPASGVGPYMAALQRLKGVRAVQYVSKESALGEMKEEFRERDSIIEGIDASVLPASFEIVLTPDYVELTRASSVAVEIRKMSWVEDVQYSREWIRRFSGLIGFMEFTTYVIGAFLFAAALFIVTNTVRLTIYARKDYIEVLRLIGASGAFIRMPFYFEGAAAGVGGGLIALAMLAIGREVLVSNVPVYFSFLADFPLSIPVFALVLAASGCFMGLVGSFISMIRFLEP